jgi:predicted CoA-substrate-specific enzyme activase
VDLKDDLKVGLDIGAVSIGMAVLAGNSLVAKDYRFHHGDIKGTLADMLARSGIPGARLALTGRGARVFPGVQRVHDVVAAVEGARWAAARPPSAILLVGGETVMLIRLNADGSYAAHEINTDCASGTGVFLDQQAARLGLSVEELSTLAAEFGGVPPAIATRCAVFAKTDLVHSQQRGHSMAAIAAGLGDGVARSLADALIKDGSSLGHLVMAGGVALNRRLAAALERILGKKVEVLRSAEVVPAIGAAALAEDRVELDQLRLASGHTSGRTAPLNPALVLEKSEYPRFDDSRLRREGDVEIALYENLVAGRAYPVFLGLDIGSTSTKLALTADGKVLLGLYTYTRSEAVQAVQRLFKALTRLEVRLQVRFECRGAGTTGSGRHLIGRLLHADLIINEISAHAKAAWSLDPAVDTIIEIGGQDSKFIRVQDGAVVQAIMNYVCAAGTGSFIEEQAARLGVALADYAGLAMGRRGPVISDRCTVHMERDLSRLLAEGWPKEELLASVLHSVRDNYMMRVVGQAKIGSRICFQGATARNKALVAAFEVALGRPIRVSPHCHLAGAIGVCLKLQDYPPKTTAFAGWGFATADVSQRSEECRLCRNRCTITVVGAGSECAAWGFQCGREYEDAAYKEKGLPFEPVRKTFGRILRPDREARAAGPLRPQKIGLPKALPMAEFLPLWEDFFSRLGFRTLVSPQDKDLLRKGKMAAQAEFCSPIILAHGHVGWLLEKGADFVFFPILLQGQRAEDDTGRNYYCFYTLHMPVLLRNLAAGKGDRRILDPVVDFGSGVEKICRALFSSLGKPLGLSRAGIRDAFTGSWETFLERRRALEAYGRSLLVKLEEDNAMAVVLLGRPYNLLDPTLNQGVPEMIEQRGFRVLTQDMLGPDLPGAGVAPGLCDQVHWHYGKLILRAVDAILANPRLFPVYLTNFRCSPDSFLMTYFRELMESGGKPYLVLQLDELSSEVGYQTRVEAGLESFRNWRPRPAPARQTFGYVPLTRDRTWILPHLDDSAVPLAQAALRRLGYEAIISEETPETIVQGLKLVGGGECVPTGAILGSVLETVRTHGLRPERTAALVPSSVVSCNFLQIPLALQIGLKKAGLEDLKVFTTGMTGRRLPRELELLLLQIYMASGLINRITARIRPYEATSGDTDEVRRSGLERLCRAIMDRRSLLESFSEVVRDFGSVSRVRNEVRRPRLAIMGDLYVVDNPTFNHDVERAIERAGGEAIPASFMEINDFNALNKIDKRLKEGDYRGAAEARGMSIFFKYHAWRFRAETRTILGDGHGNLSGQIMREVRRLGIPPELEGETAQNVFKILHSLRHLRPDAFVHINPLFCCPGVVSTALFRRLEERTGVPCIHLFYDGIHNPNDDLEPHIHYLIQRLREAGGAARPAAIF